ncbi:hypothetical protein MHYP_G00363730 [Metynnis hypsauchen]
MLFSNEDHPSFSVLPTALQRSTNLYDLCPETYTHWCLVLEKTTARERERERERDHLFYLFVVNFLVILLSQLQVVTLSKESPSRSL